MIIFLFGKCGAGKTYIGKAMAQQLGYGFVEGDSFLTPGLRGCVEKGVKASKELIDEFVVALTQEIGRLYQSNKSIVLSQALYANSNRETLQKTFPGMKFILVDAQDKVCFSRVSARKNEVSIEYAKLIRKNFESPEDCKGFDYSIIDNNASGVDSIVKQFMGLSYIVGRAQASRNTYDFIVVGSGSAGSVVSYKLSKGTKDRVLMIEAGGNPPKLNIDDPSAPNIFYDPAQWVLVSKQEGYSWQFKSKNQLYKKVAEEKGDASTKERDVATDTAKALGGCATHNAMVYVRGGKVGFDEWESKYGCKGWNYQSMLPYFREIESLVGVRVAEEKGDNEGFFKALIAASKESGVPFVRNYNTHRATIDSARIAPFQHLINERFKRETAYTKLIESQYHPNLFVASGLLVTRILFEKKTAVGVECLDVAAKIYFYMFATKEIILSAGALGSPKILMQSGVGDPKILEKLHIPVVSGVPGVGKNLQDDLYVPLQYRLNARLKTSRFGLMRMVIFGKSSPARTTSDIECSMSLGDVAGVPPGFEDMYFIYPNVQKLESRGTMKLVSKDPMQPPEINLNYLSDPRDMEACYQAVLFANNIVSSPHMKKYIKTGVTFPEKIERKAAIEHIKHTADTCYHYAGTNKIGSATDEMAVVDTRLRVRGVEHLRVVDASVIPSLVSGNSAAATMAVGARGGDLILEDHASSFWSRNGSRILTGVAAGSVALLGMFAYSRSRGGVGGSASSSIFSRIFPS